VITPGQTVGPFFSIGLSWLDGGEAVPGGDVVISGRVLDGAGAPVPDAVVETWQREPDGFARASTGEDGRWSIRTSKPAARGGAPHLAVLVHARGLLHRLATRIYFGDEAEANAADPVLAALPGDAARASLVARPAGDGGFHFDIHLQGDEQTAFFSL
jgi:protocatechuate 3,4-dioxygenase alpha subunit